MPLKLLRKLPAGARPWSLFAHGSARSVAPLENRIEEHDEKMALADLEHSTAIARDVFLPADLTEKEAAGLGEICAQHPEISALHIARKEVLHFPEHPMYVVALTARSAWWKLRGSSSNKKLVNSVVDAISLRGNWPS